MSDDDADRAAERPRGEKSRAVRVCLLGSEGAGKTCFLGGLAVLGEANRATAISLADNDHATAKYLDDLRKTLRRQVWPPATSMTRELTVRLTIDRCVIELVVFDYPGEDFREALRLLDRDRADSLYRHCLTADALLLLVDPRADLLQENVASHQILQDRQSALLKAVQQAWNQRHANSAAVRNPLDVAIIVTKCDTVADLKQGRKAKRYFRDRAPWMDAKLSQCADAVAYFAVSATGACDAGGSADAESLRAPPADLSPYGYEPVFRWVIARRKWRSARRLRKRAKLAAIAAATIALFAIVVVRGFQFHADQARLAARAAVTDPRKSIEEKIDETQHTDDDEVKRDVRQQVNSELDGIERGIAAAHDEPALDEELARLHALVVSRYAAAANRIDELRRIAAERRVQIWFDRVSAANKRRGADFPVVARDYLDHYAHAANASRVKKWLEEHESRQVMAARDRIKRLSASNAQTLKSKSDRIKEFLDGSPRGLSEKEAKEMARAAELGRRFSELNTYRVALRRSGGFAAPRRQAVQIHVGGALLNEFTHEENSKSVTWPAETALNVEWRCGQPVKVVLRDLYLQDEDVAVLESSGPLALRVIGTRSKFTHFVEGWQEACPDAFVDFVIDGVSADDWKALDGYISPGGRW